MTIKMVKAFQAPTLTDLHARLCNRLIWAKEDELDMLTSVDVQLHNTISGAESMSWDFDLKNMWLTKGRWSMMVRQYLDPELLSIWLSQASQKIGLGGRGIAVMRTKMVKPRGGAASGNRETRRWGSCMLNLSYKAVPHPTIALHSRTSYLGYIGALDLSVAWMCARYLAHEFDVPVETFRFAWYNEALQWHNFKSLAYLFNYPDEVKRKALGEYLTFPGGKSTNADAVWALQEAGLATSPALKLCRDWMQRVVAEDERGDTYGDMSYNTYRRIRRRYHTEVLGYKHAQGFEGWEFHKKGPKLGEQKDFYKAYLPLPSVDIHDLDLSAVGVRYGNELILVDDVDDVEEEED